MATEPQKATKDGPGKQKLLDLLKQAKSHELKFVFVAKGGTAHLLMGKTSVPENDVREAMRSTGGGKAVARGTCKGEDGKLVFHCDKAAPASLSNQIRLAIKTQTATSLEVEVRSAKDGAHEQPEADGKAGQAKEALDEKMRKELAPRVGDIYKRVKALGDAAPEALGKRAERLSQLLDKKDWKELEASVADTTALLAKAEKTATEEKKDDDQRGPLRQQIQALGERLRALGRRADVAVKNRVAGLFQLLSSRQWDDLKKSIAEATKLVTQNEKDVERDHGTDAKYRAQFLEEIKGLAARVKALGNKAEVKLRNLIAGLPQLLASKDWEHVEASVTDAAKELEAAEKKPGEDKVATQKRASYNKLIVELAGRVDRMGDRAEDAIKKLVGGLKEQLERTGKSGDWEAFKARISDAVKDVARAEKQTQDRDKKLQAQYLKSIDDLLGRLQKLGERVEPTLGREIADLKTHLKPLFQSGNWDEVRGRIGDAAKQVAEAERQAQAMGKRQQDQDREFQKDYLNQVGTLTKRLGELRRSPELGGSVESALRARLRQLSDLIKTRDWEKLSGGVAEVTSLLDQNEARVRDARQRTKKQEKKRNANLADRVIRLERRVKSLGGRANPEVAQLVGGLRQSLLAKDWKTLRPGLDRALVLVDAAEKQAPTR